MIIKLKNLIDILFDEAYRAVQVLNEAKEKFATEIKIEKKQNEIKQKMRSIRFCTIEK